MPGDTSESLEVEFVDAFLRVGTIADDVACADGGVPVTRVVEDGFEGGEVTVDVGDD